MAIMVVILKLVDPDDNSTTTRAIVVDTADVWLSSETNPYGITFAQGEDGVIIIESNDYNFGNENYQIVGMQLMLSGRSLQPVGQLAFLITRGRQAMATLDSLQRMMEADDERQVAMRSIVPEIRAGHIQLADVSFRYPNASRDALSGLNLKIDPGERIGIIGRVASGKSTLGRVLCGLYAPTQGVMTVDGLDSRQYHPHQLRDSFRFVSQDAEVFSGTVRDNLMRWSVTKQGKGMIRAYGYTPINPTRRRPGLEVADQAEMTLDNRHHCKRHGTQRRARSAGCVIAVQGQRILVNAELLLTV